MKIQYDELTLAIDALRRHATNGAIDMNIDTTENCIKLSIINDDNMRVIVRIFDSAVKKYPSIQEERWLKKSS